MAKKKSAPKTKAKSNAKAKKPAAKAAKKSVKKPKTVSLGRPTITAEEKLFMLFHEDFHARQIFEFLRAETVGDLEKFSPQEIIHRVSKPIRQTVDRIRAKLADRNRCLAGDEAFAIEQRAKNGE